MTDDATTYWFSPAPSEVTSSRISLDFGLRAADLFFRELVVPGLGRVWFARQLSWPVAALALHQELASHGSSPPKPTAICQGIEALACKLEYSGNPQDPSARILGRRAFDRDVEGAAWSFQQLRQATHYVRNTHRQVATRALRVDGGLGFASGSRFDLLELEPVGRALAEAFLQQRVGKGGTSLRRRLREWLGGEREPDRSETLRAALSPEHPTDEERDLVRSRLLETSSSASAKRQRLARAIGNAADLPEIEESIVVRLQNAGHHPQAAEVLVALAFGEVLDRVRSAVAYLTRDVERGPGRAELAKLAGQSPIRRSIQDLRTASKTFLGKAEAADVTETTSRAFADAVVAADDAEAVRLLVRRSGEVLGLADGAVTRGPLFRVLDAADDANDAAEGAASIEPDRTRTFRIANLHSLLRDLGRRGAR